jgi:hypothetical protein
MSQYKHGVAFTSANIEPRDSLEEGTRMESIVEISDGSGEKKCPKYCKEIFAGCCAVFTFILLLYLSSRNYPPNDRRGLSASMMRSHHRDLSDICEDSHFGCCEVYDLCHLHDDDDGNFTYKHTLVWPSRILKYDNEGSNCPRAIQMVRLYNSYYYESQNSNYSCHSSEWGCCSIDVSCDQYVHFAIEINTPEEQNKTNYTLYDISDPTFVDINLPKLNKKGTNCPSFGRIVLSYNQGYDSFGDYLWLFIIGGIVAGLYGLSQC